MKVQLHIFILFAFALLSAGCIQPVSTPVSCESEFTAAVYQGPSTGFRLQGELVTTIDLFGKITATLIQENGSEVIATGQAHGQAINLVFFVNEELRMYGVGTADNDINVCRGEMGGPLIGPLPGDSGDWASIRVKIVAPPER